MNIYLIIILSIFAFMSLITFCAMGIDKSKAKRGAWRIKEATLFLLGFFLGGVGGLIGMLTFRHKTKHKSFIILFPLFAIIDIILLSVAVYFFI